MPVQGEGAWITFPGCPGSEAKLDMLEDALFPQDCFYVSADAPDPVP